MYVNAIVM